MSLLIIIGRYNGTAIESSQMVMVVMVVMMMIQAIVGSIAAIVIAAIVVPIGIIEPWACPPSRDGWTMLSSQAW